MDSPRIIYADECGFTGSDLMNAQSPAFVFATHNYSEDEAAALLEKHCGRFQGPELKHEKLARKASGQSMVAELLASSDIAPNRVAFGLADKHFCVLVKFVDLVVETTMHLDGQDLYRDGANIALANMWNAVLSLDPEFRQRVLRSFESLVRRPSQATHRALLATLSYDHPIEPLRDELAHMLLMYRRLLQLDASIVRGFQGSDFDLSLTVAAPTMSHWRTRLGPGFDLIHDQSSHMSRQQELWQWMVGDKAPTRRVGGPGWSVDYPIGVTSTRFANSANSKALQLADVLGGALARWAKAKILNSTDDYAQTIERAWISRLSDETFAEQIATLLWPTTDIERRPTEPDVLSPFAYDEMRAERGDRLRVRRRHDPAESNSVD